MNSTCIFVIGAFAVVSFVVSLNYGLQANKKKARVSDSQEAKSPAIHSKDFCFVSKQASAEGTKALYLNVEYSMVTREMVLGDEYKYILDDKEKEKRIRQAITDLIDRKISIYGIEPVFPSLKPDERFEKITSTEGVRVLISSVRVV